jgi:hypothetical protein
VTSLHNLCICAFDVHEYRYLHHRNPCIAPSSFCACTTYAPTRLC